MYTRFCCSRSRCWCWSRSQISSSSLSCCCSTCCVLVALLFRRHGASHTLTACSRKKVVELSASSACSLSSFVSFLLIQSRALATFYCYCKVLTEASCACSGVLSVARKLLSCFWSDDEEELCVNLCQRHVLFHTASKKWQKSSKLGENWNNIKWVNSIRAANECEK